MQHVSGARKSEAEFRGSPRVDRSIAKAMVDADTGDIGGDVRGGFKWTGNDGANGDHRAIDGTRGGGVAEIDVEVLALDEPGFTESEFQAAADGITHLRRAVAGTAPADLWARIGERISTPSRH